VLTIVLSFVVLGSPVVFYLILVSPFQLYTKIWLAVGAIAIVAQQMGS
jgi:hypothetical protein